MVEKATLFTHTRGQCLPCVISWRTCSVRHSCHNITSIVEVTGGSCCDVGVRCRVWRSTPSSDDNFSWLQSFWCGSALSSCLWTWHLLIHITCFSILIVMTSCATPGKLNQLCEILYAFITSIYRGIRLGRPIFIDANVLLPLECI